MTLEYGKSRLLVPALLAAAIGLAASIGLTACGGGGGSSSGGSSGGGSSGSGGSTSPAEITVTPDSYDFGEVTETNRDDILPRQFVIRNEGTRSYNITNMDLVLVDEVEFFLDVSGGNDPCGADTFSLAPDAACTVAVEFKPRSIGDFKTQLRVPTNAPNARTILRPLAGKFAAVGSINVSVNQINACPRPGGTGIAYVSVTDQAGFSVRDLHDGHFSLDGLTVTDVRQVGGNPTDTALSLSILMDYSGSITDLYGAADNMEDGATVLVNAIPTEYFVEGEIVKYAATDKVMDPGFTSDKGELRDAITDTADEEEIGRSTAYYDTTVKAIDRIETRTTDRKAVIALTDGEDTSSRDDDLESSIARALEANVPVFTVGFGNINEGELRDLAVKTGGLFYQPLGDPNLQDIFGRVARLLFDDQYIVYFSGLDDGDEEFDVTVAFGDLEGRGAKTIQACEF